MCRSIESQTHTMFGSYGCKIAASCAVATLCACVLVATPFPAVAQVTADSTVASLEAIPAGFTFERDVVYGEGPNAQWQLLDIVYPVDRSVPRPAIVIVHGGGFHEGDKADSIFQEMMIEFAGKGYVTLSINYRLSNVAPFPAAVEDCKLAVRWLRTHAAQYGADPDRIGAIGSSAGGHLTAMLALTDAKDGLEGDGPYKDQSSRVQAAVVLMAPSDMGPEGFPGIDADHPISLFLGGTPEERPDVAAKASPIRYVTGDDPPVFVVHFAKDPKVGIHHASVLDKALNDAGVEHDTIIIAAEGHDTRMIYSYPVIRNRISAFFAKHLGIEGTSQ